jgi:hypothetical protein
LKLFAKISDADLFLKGLNEAGTAFYHVVSQTNGEARVEAVYFSSNRTVYFKGDIKPAQLQALRTQAYPAELIRLDEDREQVEILQATQE